MDNLKDVIKSIGMLPDQRINHWKNGVPQNPESWAYKVYHYHLNNPPCPMKELCRGIGVSPKKSHKVTKIINQLRKAGTWQWPKRPDREHQATRLLDKVASQHGEDVRKV